MNDGIIISELYGGKVIVKFYGPTPDKPYRHQYWVSVNGGKFSRKTGVTTLIGIKDKSKGLVIWATELARDFLLDNYKEGITEDMIHESCIIHETRLKEAASIGDEVHKWIEKYIGKENSEMPKTKEAQIGIAAFMDWVDANKVKFISSERLIYSKKHDYVGKMDIEAKVKGKLCLIDIKTSNDLRNDYLLQTAAYTKADEEESGKEYAGRWLIRLAKESEKDYLKRMEKKNTNRLRRGKDPITVKPYSVFEPMFLDDEGGNMDRDYKAFLAFKTGYTWNQETDFFLNPKFSYKHE